MKEIRCLRGLIVSLACFLLALTLSLAMLSGLEARHAAQQKQQLKAAAYRAAATCYATEGFYPQDVQYLKKHYGLKWNEDRYILRYDCFASNILPMIDVLARGEGQP